MNGNWKVQVCGVYYRSVCEKTPQYNSGKPQCEADWPVYKNESCVMMTANRSSWEGSRERCQQLGGDLVVVLDSDKSSFVRGIVGATYVWIGLHDPDLDGEWTWLDSQDKAKFMDWKYRPNEHLLKNMRCVFMRGTSTGQGKWANSYCSRKYAYICEMEASGSCEKGWISHARHCYKYNTDVVDWNKARDLCRMQNNKSDLVVVGTFTEQFWLQVHMLNMREKIAGYWTGLNAMQGKNFTWLDETAPARYFNWDARMPSYTVEEACGMLGSRLATWFDAECEAEKGYICERPADGNASYYDFRYGNSVYKILMMRFSQPHGDEVCQKLFGKNSTLIIINDEDEKQQIMTEITARGYRLPQDFWTRGTADSARNDLRTTTLGPDSADKYGSRVCQSLWFEMEGDWPNHKFHPTLRAKPCCLEYSIICEKYMDPNTESKYDFALNSSIYHLVDEETLAYDDARQRCSQLLDHSGDLTKFETPDELQTVGREVIARHKGKHLRYWVGGDPLDNNATNAISRTNKTDKETRCYTLVYDPTKAKSDFDHKLMLEQRECSEKLKFLCEEKGIHSNVASLATRIIFHWNEAVRQPKANNPSGCTGPCIGLAVALPFVAIGSVLATIAYFWFIRRRSIVPVRFHNSEEAINLTM